MKTRHEIAAMVGVLLDQLLEGFQIINFNYEYIYVNDAVARHGRRSKHELLGRSMAEVYPGIEKTRMFSRLERCMRARETQRMLNEFTFPDGSTGWFELVFEPIDAGVLILSIDVSERQRAEQAKLSLEEQLQQAQTLETIGELTSHLAHNVNNILQIAASTRDDASQPPNVQSELDEIKYAAERAAVLTRQLPAMNLAQSYTLAPLDVNGVIQGYREAFARMLGPSIDLRLHLAPDLQTIMADAGQMEQILLNLLLNARDAMPTGGTLSIETSNVTVDTAYTALHPEATPGEYVMLAVSDTGVGMDQQTQARIFEPFFSTKEVRVGTGLGLPTVSSIVKQNRGHIQVKSAPGMGATIRLFLPQAIG